MKPKRRPQARSKATRAALIAAAQRLWEAEGFDEISIDQICESAKVSVGTFYVYFKRKEHLLILLTYLGYLPREAEVAELLSTDHRILVVCQQITGLMAARLRGIDKRLLGRGIEESFRFYREMEAAYPEDLRSMRMWPFAIIARAKARGEVLGEWDTEMAALTIHWALLQGILRWAWGMVPDADLEIDLRRRVELILNGLKTKRTT